MTNYRKFLVKKLSSADMCYLKVMWRIRNKQVLFFRIVLAFILLVALNACMMSTSQQTVKTNPVDIPNISVANVAADENVQEGSLENNIDAIGIDSQQTFLSFWIDQPEIIPWDSQLNSLENQRLFAWMTGELNFYKGNADSLPDLVQLAIELDQVAAYRRVANLANFVEDHEVAQELVSRWLVLEPDSEAAHRLALSLELKKIAEPLARQNAVYHINWLLENQSNNDNDRFADIATQISQIKDKVAALEIMQLIVDEHQNDADVHTAQGNLAIIFKDTDLAKQALNQAITINPKQTNAIILLNQIKQREGDTQGAINGLYQALKNDKNNQALRTSYARMLLRDEQDKKAIYQYEYLLEDNPSDESLLFTLGVLNLENQDYQKAKKYFSRMLIVTGRLNEASFYLGRIAEEQELYQEAISHFLSVYGGNYLSESRFRAAWAYADLDQFDNAYQILQNLRFQSDSAIQLRSYLIEGQLLRRQKEYQLALDIYTEALDKQPENNDLLYARSLTAERLDRFDVVEQDLKLILAKEPDNAEALNALGYTMLNLTTRYNEAYQLIKRALQLEPENGPILDSYGWALYRLGQYQEALVYLRKALEILNDAEVAAHLGEVLWVMGDTQAAEKIWQDALKEVPDSEIVLDTINRLKNQ